MQAQVLEVPPVVTDRERADEWADRLEDLLLEVGRVFPWARSAPSCGRVCAGPGGAVFAEERLAVGRVRR